MTYPETISYLYSRLPMFSRLGESAIKKDLTNTRALCSRLGEPQKKFQSIHVAGTNGKGSTSHMLAAILQTAGYKTGLYTSPHLYDFRERIRINGEMIPESTVTDFVARIIPAIEELQPSFFEVTVAMAFDFFAEQKVDIAIIETGLGGRLDSTNVITPILSVITTIGYDHMNLLGHTLEAIAAEKAGIIKPGIPAVIGERQPESEPVFLKKTGLVESPLHFAEDHWHVRSSSLQEGRLEAILARRNESKTETYLLDLTGTYQLKNLVSALTCIDLLRQSGMNVSLEHCQRALSDVKSLTGLMGRWEKIRSSPTVIIDVAHNPDGILAVLKQLSVTPHRRLHWILGVVKDKDVRQILQLLPREATYYFTQAQLPRALEVSGLNNMASEYGLKGTCHGDVNAALASALQHTEKEDLILICGSVFIAGELNRDLTAHVKKG